MNTKTLLGGVLAGIAMFVWGGISHMGLGLCEYTMKSMPNDDSVMGTMRNSIKETGVYYFPGMEEEATKGATKEAREAAMKKWEDKAVAGPAGLVIYQTQGSGMSPKMFITQIITDICCGIIAAFLLTKAFPQIHGFLGRVGFVTTIGLVGSAAVLLPFWNWLGFPTNFAVFNILDRTIAFAFGGIVLAWFLKPNTATATNR